MSDASKDRRERGRGRTKRGKANAKVEHMAAPLEEQTFDELYNRAKRIDLSGRSSMLKAELIQALRMQQ